MPNHLIAVLCLGGVMASGAVLPVQAQISDEETQLIDRFKRQNEQIRTQRTRSLAVSPATTGGTAAAAQDDAAPVTQVAYSEMPQDAQVNLSISFGFDSAALQPDQVPKLEAMCNVMRGIDIEAFRIIGHTDAAGTAAYNERLSLLRAKEVRRHLISECGIAPERLRAEGAGEAFPADAADPLADENRRVEFQVLG